MVAAQLAGCSLAFVDRAPPHVPRGAWVACDESRLWPVVDAGYGTAMLVGAAGIASTGDGSDEDLRRVVAPVYGVLGVAALYSAYVGFRETNRCTRLRADAAAHGVYGPPGYYPAPPPHPYPPPQPYPPAPAPTP